MGSMTFAARRRLQLKRSLVQKETEELIEIFLEAGKDLRVISSYVKLVYICMKYEKAIKECNRAQLAEFFVKVDSLRAEIQLQHKTKLPNFDQEPKADDWWQYLIRRYRFHENASQISLWDILENFQVDFRRSLKGDDDDAALALYRLRCAWRYYQPLQLDSLVHEQVTTQ